MTAVYLRELVSRIMEGATASVILHGLDPMNKGHTGEALLRILLLFGIHPTDPSLSVIPYKTDTPTRRLEAISGISERLDILNNGRINVGASGKMDVVWRDGSMIAVCSSKIGKIRVKAITDLEIGAMLTEFTESGGYTESGRSVPRASVVPYVLVDNKSEILRLAERAKASNRVSKDNLNPLDMEDLNRMCAVLRERIEGCGSKDIESILGHLLSVEKPALRTRLHQKLICSKVMRLIGSGEKTILIGALPRSGKTYMGAFIAKHFKRILVITTRPGETRTQWNKVFKDHREFSTYMVKDLNSSSSAEIALSNKKGEHMVAVASIQFFKMDERDALIGLEWDLVLLDEIHEGGSTELSNAMLDTYIGSKSIRIMMTATYTKPVEYYTIPSECCCFWDLEDVRLMRSWSEPAVFARLCEKYGALDVATARDDTYKSGETDASIRACYENAPRLGILTNMMHSALYDELRVATESSDNVYGFSMRALLMPTKDGKAFQNQRAVDTFLALISGSDKMKHYKKGDMSMFARITRYWKTIGHRESDEFMTQMWFLPSGQGQLLEHVKPAMISRINANPVLKQFATLTLDSGMSDISKAVASAVIEAKAHSKKGLILLTGNVGSLGVSLPEVDVAFMLHDVESADMIYQQIMRVLTEMVNKKYGIVVDFNVWRVLTTLNTYATSRCGQAEKSSAARICWCVSHLIDVDPDLWQCDVSPETFPQDRIADELTKQWRRMLEQTGSSLKKLASTLIDLGEDQKELDRIAKYLEGGSGRTTLEVHPDQEKLPSGIEQRGEGEDEEEDAEAEAEAEDEEEDLAKKANLNDILARLIPEIALLSGCKYDLQEAMNTVHGNPKQCEALNEFLIQLYGTSQKVPFSIVLRLVKRNYEKLIAAREIFEVISNRMGVLDDPQDLIAFLGQHLKPKELEKKQNGEVFTPPDLIQQKFDKLTLADPRVWSDPSRKFLDPANGIGNYPALAFHRLLEGLKDAIPNEADRKKHILENMLYMCELNKKNVEVSRKVFDPEGVYALNLYQGSYLDLDPKKEWGVEKFDVIFGNPPYQPPSVNGKANGGKSLWPIFVEKSIKHLKVNGFLVFVHPALWRKPGNELHDLMFGKQFRYLSIHSSQEGEKTFHAMTRYDWYVLQNTAPSVETPIWFDDGISSSLMITPSLPFIVNHGYDILLKMKDKLSCGYLNAIRTHEGDARRDFVSSSRKDKFVFPSMKSSTKTKGIVLCWCSKPLSHQFIQKVIFSDGGDIQPFYDSGKLGTAEHGIYIQVSSESEGKKIQRFLKSKLVSYIVGATKWSNFQTFPEIFHSIPNPKELPDNFTDAQVYAYFGLSPEEIGRIEANQRGSGLSKYVALEAPVVPVPSPPAPAVEPVAQPVIAATTAQPDYKKMKVADLKQLCKDRKIKGITGKRKEELIEMLLA